MHARTFYEYNLNRLNKIEIFLHYNYKIYKFKIKKKHIDKVNTLQYFISRTIYLTVI